MVEGGVVIGNGFCEVVQFGLLPFRSRSLRDAPHYHLPAYTHDLDCRSNPTHPAMVQTVIVGVYIFPRARKYRAYLTFHWHVQ